MILRQWVRLISQVILVLSWTNIVDVATTLNVGTTLFHPNDIDRPCWSDEEVALLASRHVLQDIMPTDKMDSSDERYICAMIEFARLAVGEIRSKTQGNVRVVLLKALADVLGGYLRTYLLPLTKEAFYAGNVPYSESRRLFSLMEETKSLLHTDGQHWKEPMRVTVKPREQMMVIKNVSDVNRDVACAQLITYGHGKTMKIPLPFLDDDCSPHSIALPLRAHVLVAIDKPGADSLLFTFYDTALQCLSQSPEAAIFQNKVQTWLQSTILPRLDDNTWYPAFGGVRLIVNQSDTASNSTTFVTNKPKATVYSGFFSRLSPGTMIGLLIASAICVWVKVALCFLLIRCCRKRRKEKKMEVKQESSDGSGSESSVINTLVQLFSNVNQAETETDAENPSLKKSKTSEKSSQTSLSSYQPSATYLGQLDKKESPVIVESAGKVSKGSQTKFRSP